MHDHPPLSLDILNTKEKSYLGALLHTSLHKEETIIDLSQGIPTELAPTYEHREKIFEILLQRKVLLPYEQSCIPDMCYTINIKDIEKVISALMYPLPLLEEYRRDAITLLQEVQLYEAIEYMIETLRKFHLRVFPIEPRYIQLFLQILKTYSLGQLFNFIYTAVRNQAAYKQRRSHTYVPLANYIYKKITDRFERAEAEEWNIIQFNRVWGWQQSALSKLVCGRLLNLDESVLHEVIGQHSSL